MIVRSVARGADHRFSKERAESITLIEGLGVEGDAHFGPTVQHRSRVRRDPSQPNLRQVHLIHAELFTELAAAGFDVRPGELGENVTTSGVDLLSLPAGTRLRMGKDAVVELTGLRNPCVQLDGFARGLMRATLGYGPDGELIRKAGVMAVVAAGGDVAPGDPIVISLPDGPPRALQPV